jgi:hypothetical protein
MNTKQTAPLRKIVDYAYTTTGNYRPRDTQVLAVLECGHQAKVANRSAVRCKECLAAAEQPFDDPFAEPDDGTEEGAQPTDDAEYEAYLEAQAEQQWEDAGCPEWLPDVTPEELP